MRHININKLSVGKKWIREAEKALIEAEKKSEGKERSDYINSMSNIWSDLKPKLEALSARKCWYCEARELRSDRVIDHFRPKNKVRSIKPEHKGYWWLAFDWMNYRLSCTFCNSRRADRATEKKGGKGDYFPLQDEGQRVRTKEDWHSQRERPFLLDPCNPTDVALLWYDEEGRVKPKYKESESRIAFQRADKSIEHYNLNERDIVDARRAIYSEIKDLIEDGDRYFNDWLRGNEIAEYALSRVIKKLANYKKRESVFSAFSSAIIAGFRKLGSEWMTAIDVAEDF